MNNIFNPGNPYQNNVNYSQAYGTYPQQNTQLNNNQFVVKNVNSFDEAKNTSIDFYNTYLFIDFNNEFIYLKKINNNGLEDFYTFKLSANPPDKMQILEQRMFNIEKMLEKVINNVPSESDVVPTISESNESTESSSLSKGSGNVTRKK